MNKNNTHRFILFSFITVVILFTLVNAWFSFPLWKAIEGSYSALAGHIPYSDAAGYYGGAFLSSFDGNLDAVNTRRPIYCLYLSCLQRISNFNFSLTIFLQSCLFTIACSLFAFYVAKKRGLHAALISVFPVLLLAVIYMPTTLTENIGLVLGLLATIVTWHSWQEQHVWFYRVGLCMFSVALSSRSGCYFVLISLLLLPFFHPFRESKYKDFVWNIFFILFGLLLVAMLSKTFGSPLGGYQSNFAHTLYGLVTGGKTWSFVYSDPRISFLLNENELDSASIMYKQSWIRFKENPFLLVIGLSKSLIRFIQFTIMNSWGASTQNIRYFYAFLHLCFISIISYRFYKNRNLYIRDFQFIVFSFVRIFISASIIWTDGGYRVFSTVAPIGGIFIALGAFPTASVPNKAHITTNSNMCLISVFMFLWITIMPIVLFLRPLQLTPPQEWASFSNENDVYIVYNIQNQAGFVVTDQAKTFSIPAQFTKDIFLKSLNQNDSSLGESLVKINSRMKQFYIVSTYDFIRKKTYMFILENELLASNAQWFKLKAAKNADGLLIARIEESK